MRKVFFPIGVVLLILILRLSNVIDNLLLGIAFNCFLFGVLLSIIIDQKRKIKSLEENNNYDKLKKKDR